jgi:hypothetical protein
MIDPIVNPPAAVRQAEDVASLLGVANAEHTAGLRAEQASLEHYRKAGEALLKAKAAAGHGRWLKVLKEQARFSSQRASEYMRLAAGWGKLPPGGNFALKEALRVIAGEDAVRYPHSTMLLAWLDRVAEETARIEAMGGIEAMLAERDKWDWDFVREELIPRMGELLETVQGYIKAIEEALAGRPGTAKVVPDAP